MCIIGIAWAMEYFGYYLLARKFILRTDSEGIRFIFERKGPPEQMNKRATSRAESYALRVAIFDFTVEFIAGTENIADTPSRLTTSIKEEDDKERRVAGEIVAINTIEDTHILIYMKMIYCH